MGTRQMLYLLYGRGFEIHIDHIPLIQVYGGHSKQPNSRLAAKPRALQFLDQVHPKIEKLGRSVE